MISDPGAAKFIGFMKSKQSGIQGGDDVKFDSYGSTKINADHTMSTPTREEIDEKISHVETRLGVAIAQQIANLDVKFAGMDAKFAEVRSDVHKISSDISRWTLATMITIIGTMLAAIFGINQINKNSPLAAQAAPQPIVIYAQPAAPPQAPPPVPSPPSQSK